MYSYYSILYNYAQAKAKARTTEPSQPSEPVSGVPSATLQVLEQKTESAASQTRGADQQSPQVQPMPSPEIKIPMPPDALPLDKQKEYLELRRKLALHEKRLQKQKGVRLSQPKVDNGGSKGKGKGTGKKKTAFDVSKATASATPSTTPPLVEPPAPLAVQALGKAKLPGKGTLRPTPTADKPSNKTKARNKQTQKQQVRINSAVTSCCCFLFSSALRIPACKVINPIHLIGSSLKKQKPCTKKYNA